VGGGGGAVRGVEGGRSGRSLRSVALLTFDQDAETLGGVTAADAAERLRPLGLAALGANHGAGLQAALRALEAMGVDEVPLAALPNVGLASISAGRGVYPHATPPHFAAFAAPPVPPGRPLVRRLRGAPP